MFSCLFIVIYNHFLSFVEFLISLTCFLFILFSSKWNTRRKLYIFLGWTKKALFDFTVDNDRKAMLPSFTFLSGLGKLWRRTQYEKLREGGCEQPFENFMEGHLCYLAR